MTPMSCRTWPSLVKARRKSASWRIYLEVGGRPVVREFPNELEKDKWLAIFRERAALEELRVIRIEEVLS